MSLSGVIECSLLFILLQQYIEHACILPLYAQAQRYDQLGWLDQAS